MSQKPSSRFPSRPVAQLLGSNGPVHALTYSSSPGTYILTGSSDRSIRLYNPASTSPVYPPSNTITSRPQTAPPPQGKLIQTYTQHSHEVLSLAVSPTNALFASAGGDRAVLLWDVATAQTVRRFGASSTAHSHTGRVNAVTFLGGGEDVVVSAGLDCTVRVWDARSNNPRPIQVLSEAKDAVTALAPGDAEILAGSVDGRVRSYDIRMGRCVADTFPASVTSVWLARDGRTVLVGTLDSKVRLMDRRDGSCLKTYEAQGRRNEELRVQSVLGGGEGWVVAGDEMTGSETEGNEGRIWAWDVLTGKVVAKVAVPWGSGNENRKRIIGRDGKEKERENVVSCIAWRDGGFGDQFCAGGTSGVVTVFGV
ncbi:hypothetical protein VTJ04DRAFT_6240 [Mycothermus thermophilus]|uniref:uncharacterized protein n=1 Tax=Humicola insolens TaxID=85995 RepID=UPI003742BAE4